MIINLSVSDAITKLREYNDYYSEDTPNKSKYDDIRWNLIIYLTNMSGKSLGLNIINVSCPVTNSDIDDVIKSGNPIEIEVHAKKIPIVDSISINLNIVTKSIEI